MLEDFKVKVFLTVLQEKSFTKASLALGISQPAVSQNIAELEKGLGVKLFERQRNETVLTPEGEIFLRYARQHVALGNEIGQLFSPVQACTVRIATSEELFTYYIEPRLAEFSSLHHNVRFERAMFDDADLRITIRPFTGSPYDVDTDVIARMRISLMSPSMKMGGTNATHEETSCFEVLFKPHAAFACTRLCRMLKDYLASLL